MNLVGMHPFYALSAVMAVAVVVLALCFLLVIVLPMGFDPNRMHLIYLAQKFGVLLGLVCLLVIVVALFTAFTVFAYMPKG